MASSDTSPASGAIAVTTSNTVNFALCRALYIGGTGDVSVLTPNNATAVVFKAVPVGVLPVQAIRVNATGTSATDIVALY